MDLDQGSAQMMDTGEIGFEFGDPSADPASTAGPVSEPSGRFAIRTWQDDESLEAEADSLLAPMLPPGRRGRAAKHNAITIMLVDDDAVDAIAIRRSFWRLRIANPLIVARNGIEALDMLRGANGHAKVEAPFLILLDLDMPRMGGIEFLTELRGDPALRRTLVFVMTASVTQADRERAYEKNIAGYVVKPRPDPDFTPAISALERYWQAIEFPD